MQSITSPVVHVISSSNKRASLRGVTFHGRPAHADQLHLEIWWDGLNIAQDAGTFSYNDEPPWQNPFSSTLVHNTLSIEDQDQMLKASKFLWLRQAQAKWLNAPSRDILMASHNGYRHLGIATQRVVSFVDKDHLEVVDQIHFTHKTKSQRITLHWLLPDWQWQLGGQLLTLISGDHQVKISIQANLKNNTSDFFPEDVTLIRGGETLSGSKRNPIMGWASDTYGEKHPTLSLSIQYQTNIDLQLVTRFEFIKTTSSTQG